MKISRSDILVTSSDIDEIVENGSVVDGRMGGLVMGHSHDEGGIHMIMIDPKGPILYAGVMEGGEFLLNSVASRQFFDTIATINEISHPNTAPNTAKPWIDEGEAPQTEEVDTLEATYQIQAYQCNQLHHVLLIDKWQAIVNREATAKHLHALLQLNLYGQEQIGKIP